MGAILLMNTYDDADFKVNLKPMNSRLETDSFDRGMKEAF
jgi:hypothetical protein